MKIEQIIQRVESRLVELFDDAAQQERTEQASALLAAVARHEDDLAKAHARRQEVTAHLEANTEAAALMPSRIEDSVRRGKSAQAMRQALELEGLRRGLADDRAELPRLEQLIWSLAFRLRQLRRQWEDQMATKPRHG